uniref:Nascent polypeptide-associated complex subunit alpha, muscle-specific form-like n=1 Tax=Pogona vitticeps TaxID=103695 RepID=A0ABM5FCR2_9SAUR
MGQMYGNLPSPAVAGLHLVQLCPPVPGQRPQLPFQQGTRLQFYSHGSLAPIQLAESGAPAQAIPGPGASGNPMVWVLKEIDHPSVRASAPTSRPSATGPKAGALEMTPGSSASSLPKGLTNPPGEPVETNSRSIICSQSSSACPSVSSATTSAENIKTLHEGSHGGDGQTNPMLDSQLLPPAQEGSPLMSSRDDIQLPENLLTDFPDFEDLVSSMEPLLPDCIFPSLDPTEPRDSRQAQELLATPPRPCDDIGGQSQEPKTKKDVPLPRPSIGEQSEAPNKPKLDTKAKRAKSPASEGEPTKKVRKTKKTSDPTTAPNASGEGTALGAHKKPCSSLVSGKKGGGGATSFDNFGVKSQEPQPKKDVPIPRPSQGKTSEAPNKPKLDTKAKRTKSPPSEGEPSKKVRKTKKTSDPTTAPNASGEGTAFEAHKKPCSSLASGKKGDRDAPRKAEKGPANREVSLTKQSAESGKDLAPSKASKAAKKKTTTSVTAGLGPKQVSTQEPPKPVPRSHLVMQMMESLNVLYPLGKGKPQLAPVKKQLPLAPSAPEKPFPPAGGWARPLPSLPRIPKISASHSGPQPPSQPPSKSVASSIPAVAHRAAAKPATLSHPCQPKASSTQLYEPPGWRRPASTSMKTSAPLPHPPMSASTSMKTSGPLPHHPMSANTSMETSAHRPHPPMSANTSMKTSAPLPHPPMWANTSMKTSAPLPHPPMSANTSMKTSAPLSHPPMWANTSMKTSTHRPHPPMWANTSMKTSAPLPYPPMSGQSHWRVATNTQAPLVVVRHPTEPPDSSTFKGDTFIPWRTPPPDLEESKPITEEQRPIREMMKLQAQREREEAANWTAVGRSKYFVEREKEMDLSIAYGYPWRS